MKLAYLLAPALLVSTSAFAADAIYNEPVAASFDWTGAYIGANVGGAFGTFKHPVDVTDTTTTPPTAIGSGSLDISAGGFIGGVQAGYNWQSGQMVYGVEADFQGSTLKAEDKIDVTGLGDIKAGTKVDWFGTVRGRIGYAATERFMVYGTGGYAYGHVKSYIDAGPLGFDESVSKTKSGWTVGAGAEYAVTDHVTFKGEYLYTDLGKSTVYSGDVLGAGTNTTLKNDVAFHTFRVGLNYKF